MLTSEKSFHQQFPIEPEGDAIGKNAFIETAKELFSLAYHTRTSKKEVLDNLALLLPEDVVDAVDTYGINAEQLVSIRLYSGVEGERFVAWVRNLFQCSVAGSA
jgi:hypothetical protein